MRSGEGLVWLAVCALAAIPRPADAIAQESQRRLLTIDDLAAMRDVAGATLSPDGGWIAYTVRSQDPKEDKRQSDVWMAPWDGSREIRLTFGADDENRPQWSPDGTYLSFLSSRGRDDEADQLWLLNRSGGEAQQVTDVKGSIEDYVWSPDGRRVALVVMDPDPEEAGAEAGKQKPEKKTLKPIVIDRFQFKQDEVGYLVQRRHHLSLLDLTSRKVEPLTSGSFDEVLPAWSPDGASLVFVSKRGDDPDRHSNFDLYRIEARPGAAAQQITTYQGPDCDPDWESRPAFSGDGTRVAYLQGADQKLIYYGVHQLAVAPAAGGGSATLPAPKLDRNVSRPRWSHDGASVYVVLEEDGNDLLARIPAAGGGLERMTPSGREVGDFDVGRDGKIVVVASGPQEPAEVFVLERGVLRRISHQNDALLGARRLGAVEEISFKSRDGTPIHGFLVKPPDYRDGTRYPTLLRIHGGPTSQFDHGFSFEWQLFAANGYAVVAANPRGSSGRGEAFATAIYADWGDKDAQDVLAAVDHAVTLGVADPERLGVGGWSYGGMLTNYVIAQDGRFKAAASGASISNILAGYGTDQYIREYEAELGPPWKSPDVWERISFPFLHADRITTPTLFLCGDKDFNVPLLNSEQMYQALRSLGRDTQLVIYPGQFHEIAKPGYLRDRLERYLAWYGKYLSPRK